MQEIITGTKTKTVTSLSVLSSLLNILIKEGYSFNKSEEIQLAIKNKFNMDISLELIEELWLEDRLIESKQLEYINYGIL